MKHKSDGDTNCNWRARYSHQKIATGTGGLGNKRTSGYHPNYSIVEMGQNTKTSCGNLRRLAVSQTPVKNHQLMLVWKTPKGAKWDNDNNLPKKKKNTRWDFVVPAGHRVKIKDSKMIARIPESCRQRAEKAVEHESDSGTNYSWSPQTSSQRPRKETSETENQRKNWGHTNHRNFRIN